MWAFKLQPWQPWLACSSTLSSVAHLPDLLDQKLLTSHTSLLYLLEPCWAAVTAGCKPQLLLASARHSHTVGTLLLGAVAVHQAAADLA